MLTKEVFFKQFEEWQKDFEQGKGLIEVPTLVYRGRYGHIQPNDKIKIYTTQDREFKARVTSINFQLVKSIQINFVCV